MRDIDTNLIDEIINNEEEEGDEKMVDTDNKLIFENENKLKIEAVDKEKQRLIERFENVKEQLMKDSKITISEVYSSYDEENYLKNRKVDKKKIISILEDAIKYYYLL